MKKTRSTILASLFIMALMASVVSVGTLSYFSEIATVSGNTFVAGTMDVRISKTGTGNWKKNLGAIWNSPSGWAPGESFSGAVYFKNFGDVDIQVILVDLNNYAGSPTSFRNVIEVEEYIECKLPGTNYAPHMDGWFGNSDGILTLHELMETPNVAGSVGNCDNILYEDPGLPPHGAPLCTSTHLNLLGNTYLAPGETGWLYMKFKFSNSADITYQGATASFDLKLTFVQGPDSGLCRHELPGFIP